MNTPAQRLLQVAQLSAFLSDSDASSSGFYLCNLWKFSSCHIVARLQLTSCPFSGWEEECQTTLTVSVQQESIFASLKRGDCYVVGSTNCLGESKVRSGHS